MTRRHLIPTPVAGALALLLAAAPALAGPPFATDDPEPVERGHWELYLAGQASKDPGGWEGTAPHFEVNYGAFPGVQLHAIVPLGWAAPEGGPSTWGPGDVELGVKVRFLEEGEWLPQVGTFPMLELPTGSAARGLGAGTARVFLPLWLQKAFGPWTTYGGAGLWLNREDGVKNQLFLGWQVQRKLGEALALGVELFHLTAGRKGGAGETRFNLGAIVDLSATHHLLLSAGRSLGGEGQLQAYAAWQVTLGPAEGGGH